MSQTQKHHHASLWFVVSQLKEALGGVCSWQGANLSMMLVRGRRRPEIDLAAH